MPKNIFDYGKTEIYKIIHVDPAINLSYVGHTTNFVQREKNHKYTCENKNGHGSNCNCQVYNVIRSNGGGTTLKWSLLKSGLVRINERQKLESNIGLRF